MKKIYIIGAGGFGREVAWLIERINYEEQTWDIQGFIDDNEAICGGQEGNYPVLGTCDFLEQLDAEVWVVCAIGSAKTRERVIEKVEKFPNIKFATLIDPSVMMSSSVKIGEGSIICAGTILTVNIDIGRHVIINLDCTVGHDAILKSFVTIYPSVNISGCVSIGAKAEIGTGSHLIQGITVGEDTIIGAGAVIIRDVPPGCTAVGNPAKPIKYFGERYNGGGSSTNGGKDRKRCNY